MRRVTGTILFGIGILFLVVAVGLPVYVAPAVTKLPYDLKPSTSLVEAKSATYLQVSDGQVSINKGDLRSITQVVPQPKLTDAAQGKFQDKAVVWDVWTTVSRADNDVAISQSSNRLALDRVTAVCVDWDGAFVRLDEDEEVRTKFAGQIYKFPFHTEKTKDYPFWDGELGNASIPARFRAVEEVGGLEVYRFEQVIAPVKTNRSADDIAFLLAGLEGPKASGATSADIYYSNTRTFWVEPVTGQFLDLSERRRLELRDDKGGSTVLLEGEFRYAKQTVEDNVKTAGENRFLIKTVSLYAPIGLGLLGLLLAIIGVILVVRGSGGSASRHGYSDY